MFIYAFICAMNLFAGFAYDLGIMTTIYEWTISFGSAKDVIIYAGLELAVLTSIAVVIAQFWAFHATKDLRKEDKLLNVLMWIV